MIPFPTVRTNGPVLSAGAKFVLEWSLYFHIIGNPTDVCKKFTRYPEEEAHWGDVFQVTQTALTLLDLSNDKTLRQEWEEWASRDEGTSICLRIRSQNGEELFFGAEENGPAVRLQLSANHKDKTQDPYFLATFEVTPGRTCPELFIRFNKERIPKRGELVTLLQKTNMDFGPWGRPDLVDSLTR